MMLTVARLVLRAAKHGAINLSILSIYASYLSYFQQQVFNQLYEALHKLRSMEEKAAALEQEDGDSMYSSSGEASPASNSKSVDSPSTGKKSVESSSTGKKSVESSSTGKKSVGSSSSSSSSSSQSNLRMDVADFIKCSEIDDVLVQALTRRARLRVIRLMKKAEEIYHIQHSQLQQQQQQQSSNGNVGSDGGGSGRKASSPPSSPSSSSSSSVPSILDIASGMLIKRFKVTLK